MSKTFGHIQLQFEAEFSNAIIVHITCDAVLQKQLEINVEMDEQDLVSVVAYNEYLLYCIFSHLLLSCRKDWG